MALLFELARWFKVFRTSATTLGVVLGLALAGCLVLVCATTAYYGTDLLFDGGPWWDLVTRYWLIVSLLFGPPLRRGGR